MNGETRDRLREIKARFRLLMNGDASRSMREKGMGYGLNWGVGLMDLKRIAAGQGRDYDLAVELWREDVRECKILATLLMPPERMGADLVGLWVGQVPNQEVAEMMALNLLQHVEGAKGFALGWIASERDVERLCGYNVLSRLFMRGDRLDGGEAEGFIDRAGAAVRGGSVAVRHAALNCLSRFAAIDGRHERAVASALGDVLGDPA